MVVHRNHHLVYSCLFVHYPGNTSFVFTAPVSADSLPDSSLYSLSLQAFEQLCLWAFREGSILLQIMTEPADTDRQSFCHNAGFSKLTDLVYLARSCHNHEPPSTLSPDIRWIPYEDQHHALLKSVIAQTYKDSLDCPELENLRSMEDIVIGHKAAGLFDPRWWHILFFQNTPAGVLLLTPLRSGNAMEITYMGLCPAFRKKGLGNTLVRQAIYYTSQSHVDNLILAVDCRNLPAYSLYTGNGFNPFLRRTVLIRPHNPKANSS
jgi:ribosomal protein S18 acetylase RimI-like enzyme